MTSLNSDGGHRSPGATFFGGAASEETFLLNPDQANVRMPDRMVFRGTVSTLSTTVFQMLLMIGMEVIICMPRYCPRVFSDTEDRPFRALAALHASLWLLLLLIGWQHAFSHRKSKTRGYLSFHRKSRFVRKAPFYILSVGSMLLLLFSVVWEQSDKESDKSRMTCIRILYTIELVLCVPVTIVYLVQVTRFNRRADLPDVYRELMARVQTANSVNQDVALPMDHDLDDVLEKQADIIRFMKQHNESLSRRIRTLTEQLACYEQGERPAVKT